MVNFITHQEYYGHAHTEDTGRMYIFSLSHEASLEIYAGLDELTSEPEAAVVVRKIAQKVCFPKSSLVDGKYKPDNPVLSDEQVEAFTELDLEKIAKLYVKHNEHLFKKSLAGLGKYGDIEYPRKAKESYVKYLTRLTIKECKLQKERWDKVLGVASAGLPKVAPYDYSSHVKPWKVLSPGKGMEEIMKEVSQKSDMNFRQLGEQIAKSAKKASHTSYISIFLTLCVIVLMSPFLMQASTETYIWLIKCLIQLWTYV